MKKLIISILGIVIVLVVFYIVMKSAAIAPNGELTASPTPTATPTAPTATPTIPVPTCMPLPEFCLGSSADGDPINICTWLDAPVYCPLTQKPRCNQSCSATNPCASGFTCTGIVPVSEATGSAVTPTYVCRKADKPYDSTCSN